MQINSNCINCGACIEECENNAIYNAGESYIVQGVTHPPLSDEYTFIVPDLCDSCKTCVNACVVDAIEE